MRPLGDLRPRGRLRRDLDRHAVPVDARVGGVEVQVLGDHPTVHGQQDLHQAGDARGRLQVAHVGLHGADEQRAVRRSTPAVDLRGRVQLDGVAHLRAGAVGLQVVDLVGLDAGLEQGLLDNALLGCAAGHRHACGCAVLVDRRPQDDAPYPVAVRLCVAQPLEDHHATAFAAHEPVRRRVEGLALAVGGEHPRIGPKLGEPAEEYRLHAADDVQVGLVPLQGCRCLVQREQRRRARGVDGHRRALQA